MQTSRRRKTTSIRLNTDNYDPKSKGNHRKQIIYMTIVIAFIICLVVIFKLLSSPALVSKVDINIDDTEVMPLNIDSYRRYYDPYKPQNILQSDRKEYRSKYGVTSNDWIILSMQDKNINYYPIKIRIKGVGHSSSVKQFSLSIGSSSTNEWIQLHQNILIAKQTDIWQEFELNLDEKEWNTIKAKHYHQFKLLLINNHDSRQFIRMREFKLETVENKQNVAWSELDLKNTKNAKLNIHLHNGHFWEYEYIPQNILESNDKQYCDDSNAWILFTIKDKNSHYYPTKIRMKGLHYGYRLPLKQFSLSIGSSSTNKWIQLHKSLFTAKIADDWQEFELFINDMDWKKIQIENYNQFKLSLINNSKYNICIEEMRLFGVNISCMSCKHNTQEEKEEEEVPESESYEAEIPETG